MDVDGSHVVTIAGDPAGSEFDGDWSPDGEWVVYRDSTRGINENDEIAIARADGSERRIITNDVANDWGPPGRPMARRSRSTRIATAACAYLVAPDGTNLQPMGIDAWVEYPSFSPDGSKIAFMGHQGRTTRSTSLTSRPRRRTVDRQRRQDGWPSWSPDGSTIAFTSVRDDCRFAARDDECWQPTATMSIATSG